MNDDLPPDWASEGYDPEAEENVSQYIRPLEEELAPIRRAQAEERGAEMANVQELPEERTLFSMIPGLKTLSEDEDRFPLDFERTEEQGNFPLDFERVEEQAKFPLPERAAAAPASRPAPRPAAQPSGAPRPPADLTGDRRAESPSMLSRVFTKQDFQSNNRPVIENGQVNWGDPQNPADFVRANAAMTQMLGSQQGASASAPTRARPNERMTPPGNIPSDGQLDRVDPRLRRTLNEARSALPSGYTMQFTSGFRSKGSGFHPKGEAVDVILIDPEGRRLANYQDPRYFDVYENFAKAVRQKQQELFPELDKSLRWGGYFSGGKGKYGAFDLMHFDLGGDRVPTGGGSWESGLTPEQRRIWGIPARAEGGRVELLQDEFPTQYLPNVGRQVMNEGGAPADFSDFALSKLEPFELDAPVDTKKGVELTSKDVLDILNRRASSEERASPPPSNRESLSAEDQARLQAVRDAGSKAPNVAPFSLDLGKGAEARGRVVQAGPYIDVGGGMTMPVKDFMLMMDASVGKVPGKGGRPNTSVSGGLRMNFNDGGPAEEDDAMRLAREIMTTDPMGTPTMAGNGPQEPEVRRPREDLEARLSAGQQAMLSQIGVMLPNKAADIKEDDSGAYPVDAEGNKLDWIKRPFLSFVAKDEGENRYGLPYVLDVLTAGTGGGGMAAPVKKGGTYLGSGPILKKAEAASDAAANSAAEAAQAVSLAKRELSQSAERPSASRIISQAGEYGDYVPKGGRERDPRKWHPISNTALSRPLAEMSAEHVLVGPRTERKFIKPEELEGKALIPALADRTAGGSLLTKVNEMKLENPVKMQAGEGFMYGPAAKGKDKAAWASDPGIISALANKAKASAEKGLDPYLAYVAMGSRSGDYSHHMTDTLLEMLKNSKVSKDTVKEFDEQMRTNTANKWKAYKDWPGLTSPKIEDYLYGEGPAKARTKMAELMGQGQFQKAGMPDVGAARFAITAPELLHAEDYSAGRSIVKLDPQGRRIKNPEVPHKTYKDQLGADPDVGYVGGFEYDVPFNVMNKEFVDKLMAEDPAKYSNPSMMAYTYRMNQPTVEMTPEVVDRLSKYLEMKKRGLIP